MKIIYGIFETRKIVYFINNDSSRGSDLQIDNLGLLNQFLKDETIAISPSVISWVESLLMLFVPQSMTTFFNPDVKPISLTRRRTCLTRSPRMSILINPSPKRFFHTLL